MLVTLCPFSLRPEYETRARICELYVSITLLAFWAFYASMLPAVVRVAPSISEIAHAFVLLLPWLLVNLANGLALCFDRQLPFFVVTAVAWFYYSTMVGWSALYYKLASVPFTISPEKTTLFLTALCVGEWLLCVFDRLLSRGEQRIQARRSKIA